MNSVTIYINSPRIIAFSISNDTLSIDLEDGRSLSVPISWFPRLAYGSEVERGNAYISGAGYGLHWPDLDEDLSVVGLLTGKKSGESPESLQNWLKSRSERP